MQVTAEKASRVDALIGYIKQLESRFGVEYA